MSSPTPIPFEMRGTFRGFFRDVYGKRRMVLRVGSEEHFLKVPKELREQLAGRLATGEKVVAVGVEEGHKRVVSSVRSAAGTDLCAACPIHVCAKKNCWRGGGRELWATLERRLADAGLAGVVELKAVDCLGHCKHAPNAEWQGRVHRRCGPAEAAALVAQVAAALGRGAGRSNAVSHPAKGVLA